MKLVINTQGLVLKEKKKEQIDSMKWQAQSSILCHNAHHCYMLQAN